MKNMEMNFIPIEEAKDIEELGFDYHCFADLIGFGDGTIVGDHYVLKEERMFINGDYITSEDVAEDLELHQFGICGVPLWQQAFEFFREKYHIQAEILWRGDMDCFCYKTGNFEYGSHTFSENDYKTYEEAQLECLRTLIKLVKNDN